MLYISSLCCSIASFMVAVYPSEPDLVQWFGSDRLVVDRCLLVGVHFAYQHTGSVSVYAASLEPAAYMLSPLIM
jgi:hypothetical protein